MHNYMVTCLVYSITTIHETFLSGLHKTLGSVQDLRTGSRWFNPRLGQYSFRGLMIVVVTGFIPLSPLSIVSTMVMWESSLCSGPEKSIVRGNS